jgi:hypothetical protein
MGFQAFFRAHFESAHCLIDCRCRRRNCVTLITPEDEKVAMKSGSLVNDF